MQASREDVSCTTFSATLSCLVELPLMKRVVFTVGVIALICGALITFPAYIHWLATL